MESIRRLYSCLEDPLLNTILDRKRRFSIGKGDIMATLLQSFAEIQRWISRTCPFPIAEKMKDFQRIETYPRVQAT